MVISPPLYNVSRAYEGLEPGAFFHPIQQRGGPAGEAQVKDAKVKDERRRRRRKKMKKRDEDRKKVERQREGETRREEKRKKEKKRRREKDSTLSSLSHR